MLRGFYFKGAGMTEKQKRYLENLGVEIIDLKKVSYDDLSDDDKEFVNFIESDGGVVSEIYHF